MTERYLSETITASALAEQRRYYGASHELNTTEARDALGEAEMEFIARRDSFYLASITSSGWPYVQHRGGPRGFLRMVDQHTLAFADLRGNRQLISAGNLAAQDRVSLMLMDYARRERLKILGHARVYDARDDAALADRVALPELRRKVERVVMIDVVGFDWNCPAHITPRYTAEEIREALAAGWRP